MLALIVTAGQQTREMVLCEPYLANRDETPLPLPAGPVFLSIPLDDWEKPTLGPAVARTVSHRVSPDA